MNNRSFILFLTLFIGLNCAYAQFSTGPGGGGEDDLTLGNDIFDDFSENVESSQVLEDERFFRYGRYYSVNSSIGATTFTGNRGIVTESESPTLGLSVVYFYDFQSAVTLGLTYSKHSMIFNSKLRNYTTEAPGMIEISYLRAFLGYRYYLDTSNLGTAITYANPYMVVRMEYWYQSNKFIDLENVENESDGGFGTAFGGGLEFPIEIRKYYVGLEFLYHKVNFFDLNTRSYEPLSDDATSDGVSDLQGDAFTFMLSYVANW